MMPSSDCPPWLSDQSGPYRKSSWVDAYSYTTPRDTIRPIMLQQIGYDLRRDANRRQFSARHVIFGNRCSNLEERVDIRRGCAAECDAISISRVAGHAAFCFAFSQPRLISTSAICTAFSAAPLRRLSETHQKARPFSTVASSRMREI